MSSLTQKKVATLDDLRRVDGKAELIGGRIVHLMPTGNRPNLAAGEIFVSLKNYRRAAGRGAAFTDNMGFAIAELPSGRESFSPDASYYDGPPPSNEMDFVAGPPTFAVKVRSKSDYSPRAEREIAVKIADYFAAGTQVVWDVELLGQDTVRVHRAAESGSPTIYRRGQIAEAEPAVPGWTMSVDDLFD